MNADRGLDQYGTLAPIGAGSMGRVYAGFDATRGLEVAIKRLHRPDPAAAQRMRREARVLQRLDHPNLCPLLDWGESGADVWLVMPLLRGADLQSCLADLDLETRLQVLVQACLGVHAAHEAGLVHRDLKPANLWVDRDHPDGLRVWVMDFGIARSDDDATLTALGDVLGTPAYMSPEQAEGRTLDIDRRSDIWSLGAILFTLLCQRAPFDGATARDAMAQVRDRDAPSPRRYNPETPRALERICLRCLERDPGRRYGSAAALADDLRRYLAGQSVLAPAAGLRFHLRRAVTRHPWAWGISATLAGGLVLSASTALWTHWRSEAMSAEAAALSQRAERVRNSLHIAHLAPLHDTRADRARVMADLTALARHGPRALEATRLRSLAAAQRALGEDVAASTTLAALVAHPDALGTDHLAHAEVLLDRYLDAAADTTALPPDQRSAVLEHLQHTLRSPAEASLERAGLTDLPPGLRARQALAADRPDQALQALDSAAPARADDASLWQMRGGILLASARLQRLQGHLDEARRSLEDAGTALAQALTIQRSDPAMHRLRCQWSIEGLRLATSHGTATAVTPDALDPACSGMLTALPDDPASTRTRLEAWEAIIAGLESRNALPQARDALTRALQEADHLLDTQPGDAANHRLRARLLRRQAGYDYDDYRLAQQRFDAALADLDAAETLQPNDWSTLLTRGHVLSERGRHQANFRAVHTVDPLQDYQAAIRALSLAVERRPQSLEARQRLSLVHIFSFYQLRESDPEAALAEAGLGIQVLDPALTAHPDNPDLLFDQGANIGDRWLFQAVRADRDSIAATLPELQRGLDLLARVMALAPQRADAYAQRLALAGSASERLRALDLPRTPYVTVIDTTLAEAARQAVSVDPAMAAWALIEAAEQHLDQTASRTSALAAATQALAAADDRLRTAEASPDHRFDAWRYRVQWAVAAARRDRLAGITATASLAAGERTVRTAEASERGREDNILWCEAGRLALEHSRHAGPAARTAAQTAVQRLERCRARGEIYFQAHYGRVLDEARARAAPP